MSDGFCGQGFQKLLEIYFESKNSAPNYTTDRLLLGFAYYNI